MPVKNEQKFTQNTLIILHLAWVFAAVPAWYILWGVFTLLFYSAFKIVKIQGVWYSFLSGVFYGYYLLALGVIIATWILYAKQKFKPAIIFSVLLFLPLGLLLLLEFLSTIIIKICR